MPNYRVFSAPYFPVFELNTEIYSVNLRIQSEYRKIRTRKNSVFGHFHVMSSLFKIFGIKHASLNPPQENMKMCLNTSDKIAITKVEILLF